MANFTAEQGDIVVAACQTGAEEASQAVSRAFDGDYAISPPDAFSPVSIEELKAALAGPGLAIELSISDEDNALFFLSESSGLLPKWVEAPDATGEAKLLTLAQELGMVFLPEDFMPLDFRAAYVPDLASVCQQANISNDGGQICLAVKDEEDEGQLFLVWSARVFGATDQVVEEEQPEAVAEAAAATPVAPPVVEEPAVAAPRRRVLQYNELEDGIQLLPSYARSLLKVRVPVRVILASTKLPLQRVEELGPGSIIQFRKSCDETLSLEVGGCTVAAGEAVKVGDKFGLWITAIQMPEEKFDPIQPGS